MGEYALVIADEVDGQAKHRADLSSYREVCTTGYRHRKLTRIVDTLHFAPSRPGGGGISGRRTKDPQSGS